MALAVRVPPLFILSFARGRAPVLPEPGQARTRNILVKPGAQVGNCSAYSVLVHYSSDNAEVETPIIQSE